MGNLNFIRVGGGDALPLAGGTLTGALAVELNTLGTTPTAGLTLLNTTAAAAGAQQVSPSLVLEGRGWKTNATAESQIVRFRQNVLPVQGAANPSGTWQLQSEINASGTWADHIRVAASTGIVTIGSSSIGGAGTALSIQSAYGTFTAAVIGGGALATSQSITCGPLFATSVTLSDVILSRDAPNVLAQRNGTNQQTTRHYDTYTSATDYHRLTTATARISQTAASGVSLTLTELIPIGAVVVGVTSKITTALGDTLGLTGYQIGTAADPDRWGVSGGITAGITTDNRNWTDGTIECFSAATDVILTSQGGNFDGTGVIYVSVQYLTGEAD